jgi:hypothetical protein
VNVSSGQRPAPTLEAMTQPVALVLDQVELLDNRGCLDALAELALRLPARSTGDRPARNHPFRVMRSHHGVVKLRGWNSVAG